VDNSQLGLTIGIIIIVVSGIVAQMTSRHFRNKEHRNSRNSSKRRNSSSANKAKKRSNKNAAKARAKNRK
jgi:hypothetical protein